MKEVDNVIRILVETKEAIENEDYSKIKLLSNQTINTASLTQDPDNIAVAVIVYSLSEILGNPKNKTLPGWKIFQKSLLDSMDISIVCLKKDQCNKFRIEFEKIRKSVGELSGKLKHYIQEVMRRAKINKASKLYEHGISLAQTAKLLGITMFELAEYAGTKNISDAPESKTKSPARRVKLAEEIFK